MKHIAKSLAGALLTAMLSTSQACAQAAGNLTPATDATGFSALCVKPGATTMGSVQLCKASDLVNKGAGGLPMGFPRVTPTNWPVQYAQIFGPTMQAAQASLVGRVGFMWSTGYGPQGGIVSSLYTPAYRLYYTPTGWTGTLLAWLYANHPDWIVYGSDKTTPAWEFSNTTYPPIDISNPAAETFLAQSAIAAAAGFQGIGLDNIDSANDYLAAGHYTNTIAPCPTASQPACNGTWVPRWLGASADPVWASDNLAYLAYLRSAFSAASLFDIGNLANGGGASSAIANFATEVADLTGVLIEGVPQHMGTETVTQYHAGFIVDALFQADVADINSVGVKPLVMASYLNGHDTDSITTAEKTNTLAFFLLLESNPNVDYLSAAQSGSRELAPYPLSMGGYSSLSTTGTVTAGSATVTGIATTAPYALGQTVTAAGLPPNDYITAIPGGGATLTLFAPATATFTGEPIGITGSGQLPLGHFTQAAALAGSCGLVGGAINDATFAGAVDQGVCSRTFTRGAVYFNGTCKGDGAGNCQIASETFTIPAPPSGQWWDSSCNVVPTGPYTLAAGAGLIIAYGSTSTTGCPWPQP